MSPPPEQFDLDLVVVGLGYVGMPLVQGALGAGLSVVGFDVNTRLVDQLNGSHSHIDDLSDDDIKQLIADGFYATTDSSALGSARTVVVCVPTPLGSDGGPDLTAVESASQLVADHLRPGMLVVLESTTYPGTTDEVVRPILEREGLTAGRDFNLAFSPERIDPGNRSYGLANTPKVVGGHSLECTERASNFYGAFVDKVVRAKGTREAEMAKLLENTYRHVNIALVNEMARFSNELDIDLWDSIRCAATKPFGFQAFYPGPGVGGHCIPIDPNYLGHNVRKKLGYPFRFVELAQEINAGMPAYVFRRAQDVLNRDRKPLRGSSVLLLGVTYKADIADQRESPVRPLAEMLLEAGAELSYHDPCVPEWKLGNHRLRCVEDLDQSLAVNDLCILLQNHAVYDVEELVLRAQRLFDTRGVTVSSGAEVL